MASSRTPARPHLPAARRAVVALGVAGALAVSVTPAAAEPAPTTSREAAALVADRARPQLDPVPRHHICRDQLRKSHQRPPAQLGGRPGPQERPAEPVRGAHI